MNYEHMAQSAILFLWVRPPTKEETMNNYQTQGGKCFACTKELTHDIQAVFEYENGERFTAKVCNKCADNIKKGLN